MELNKVKDAFDRLTKKQELSFSKANEVVDFLQEEINSALRTLQAYMDQDGPSSDHKAILTELTYKLNEMGALNYLGSSHKELNIAVDKYAKVLEESFFPDISKAYRNVNSDTSIINQIIAIHFYRHGLFDLGDSFIAEAGDSTDAASLRIPFLEMHQILKAMESRNLEPAMNWASSHRDKLSMIGSKLELELHKLRFAEVLQDVSISDAFQYAQKKFASFAAIDRLEIQRLMASLLVAGHLEHFLHEEPLSPRHWESLAKMLTRNYCHLLGQALNDPLRVVVAAGIQGFPTLLKLSAVEAYNKWQTLKQLPVPVDLGKEFQFHSVFVCPVAKDPASEENPPMLLRCGHIICRLSMAEFDLSERGYFECPYCHRRVKAVKCRVLHF